jgi:hypothetical protein
MTVGGRIEAVGLSDERVNEIAVASNRSLRERENQKGAERVRRHST